MENLENVAVATSEVSSNTADSIRRETTKGSITCSRVYTSDYQAEDTQTAELRQENKTLSYYPTRQITSNMQDNPFGLADFGFNEEPYESIEKRVGWIDVPVGKTVEDMNQALAGKEGCTLYKVLSNKPILTNRQKYAISQGLRTMDQFADAQVVRYGENYVPRAGQGGAPGQLITDLHGKIQYRRVFYSNTPKEDIDMRNAVPEDLYMSTAISAEVHGQSAVVHEGQEIVI